MNVKLKKSCQVAGRDYVTIIFVYALHDVSYHPAIGRLDSRETRLDGWKDIAKETSEFFAFNRATLKDLESSDNGGGG